MKQPLEAQHERRHYAPAVLIHHLTVRHSLSRVPVTMKGGPDHICGTAQRVGYTGKQDHDLAIYRLKIKPGPKFSTITLPGFFVIENGVFVDYEQWRCAVEVEGAD